MNAAVARKPVLFARDVAALWSARAGRPVAVSTVWSYLEKSKPAGRYAARPVPAPSYDGGRPWWPNTAAARRALVAWWDGHDRRTGPRAR